MADRSSVPLTSDVRNIYNDTENFIGNMTSEYGIYGSFIDALKNGSATMEVRRKQLNKTVDQQWIRIIEECLPSLDASIRTPTKSISQREEVLPIEMSRNITAESYRHLAQHTDLIRSIDKDGNVTPDKILNVFREETLDTYENKFLNTLIDRLFSFVNRRYNELGKTATSETSVTMGFSSEFKMGATQGKITMNIDTTDSSDEKGGFSLTDRIAKLNGVASQYLDSEFSHAMGHLQIRPPVMRTNAILKNKDLRQCLALWEFIESYDKVGYVIEAEESSEKPDEKYLNGLYSLLSLQYMIFRHSLACSETAATEVIESMATDKPIAPNLLTRLRGIEPDDYNVYDAEYRRIIPVSQLASSRKHLSKSEQKVRQAIEIALAAEKIIAQRKKIVEEAAQKKAEKWAEKRRAAIKHKR